MHVCVCMGWCEVCVCVHGDGVCGWEGQPARQEQSARTTPRPAPQAAAVPGRSSAVSTSHHPHSTPSQCAACLQTGTSISSHVGSIHSFFGLPLFPGNEAMFLCAICLPPTSPPSTPSSPPFLSLTLLVLKRLLVGDNVWVL